jgi:RNA polymerase primary sigma factor
MANARLVAHVAKRYSDRGIPAADLIQEGFCALLVAIDRFDVANNTRLATYAIWWIRQAIQRAVAAGAYPVRLSPRQLRRLAQAHEARAAGEPDQPGHRNQSIAKFSPHLRSVFAATRPRLSLDAVVRSDGTTGTLNFVVRPGRDDARAEEINRYLGTLIEALSPREQVVLKLRFGLSGEPRQTLVQVGHVLRVSKERVRQIEERALQKLRDRTHGRELWEAI